MADIAIRLSDEEKLTLQRAMAHAVEHLERVAGQDHFGELSTTFGIAFTQEKIARLYAKLFPEAIAKGASKADRAK